MILPLPPLRTSHTQPDAKRLLPASIQSARNFSQPPSPWIRSPTSPAGGAPPPPGLRLFHQNVWFQTWAALLNTPPELVRTTSSRVLLASGLPSRAALSFAM